MGQRLRTGLGRCLLLLLVLFAAAAHAQMPGSYSVGATVTVSSNPTGPVGNIIDGLDNTQWQSGESRCA
jgi:hypothetical protein